MDITEVEEGKNYFCQYTAFIDPDTVPLLAGKGIGVPTTMQGVGQLLKRDVVNRLVEVIDLDTHQRHVCSFDDIKDLQEVD